MKRSRYSPASASMICSSRPVPSVTVTSACVSPRVNSAEPWVRGSTPVRMVIGRTVRVSRPSMRGSPSRIWLRTIFDSTAKHRSFTVLASGPPSVPTPTASNTRFQIASIASERAPFWRIAKALRRSASDMLDDLRRQRLVLGRGFPVPGRLGGHFGQFLDGGDRRLHLLVAVHHGAEHHVFGQFERLGFDHQHALRGAGDHQVEPGFLELRHASG